MAAYSLHRLDGDPTYAPGRVYDKGTPWWRPTKADIKAGYKVKSYRLTGTDEEQAAKCRELVRELLQWRAGAPKMQHGTWNWIIASFFSDDLSPYFEVKENTQQSYRDELSYWRNAIGDFPIKDTTFAVLKTIKREMEAKGRSVSFIHRKFSHLRIVAKKYGQAVDPPLFRDVCAVFASGALKARQPKPRTVAPTEAQMLSIIAAADAAGDTAVALGLSLQWTLTLRAVDVRGQWLGKGKAQRWADGLTWDMVDLKAGTITKSQSKTERHDGVMMKWDLTPLPDLLQRLASIPEDERVGPVIKRHGTPFKVRHYTALFRKYARAAGVPDEVQMMDIRAGAVNDGLIHGADRTQLQHAAGHKDGKTTERYIRARDVGANKVIAMRARTANSRDAG